MSVTIYIADACKAGLVMTSEACKDKIPGAFVLYSKTGEETLNYFSSLKKGQTKPDLCIVDFDLPDTDGITLITALRRIFDGPIFLTAYPDRVAKEAAEKELFAFADAGAWLKKPLKTDDLHVKLELFLSRKSRLEKRFSTDLQAEIQFAKKPAKLTPVQKRKISNVQNAKVLNMSLGGACLQMDLKSRPVKSGETLVLRVDANKKSKKNPDLCNAHVTWIDAKKNMFGVQFDKIDDEKKLELLLRSSV